MRFSKPVYEGLPWLYSGGGAVALVAGYRIRTGVSATLLSLLGLIGIIGGIAVWLRRRDSRARSAEYGGEEPPAF